MHNTCTFTDFYSDLESVSVCSFFGVNLLLDIPVIEGSTVFPLSRFCLLFHMAENDHSNLVKYPQPGGKTCVSCLFTMAYRAFQ